MLRYSGLCIFVIAYCSVIGLTGKRKTPETEQSSGTESTSGTVNTEETTETQSSTGDTQPPEKPDKVIALTFDDGPSLSVTPKILDLLEKYGAKATFFPVGYNLTESKMAYLRRALSMGCEIGNHSDSHPISLTRLTDEEILRQNVEKGIVKKLRPKERHYLKEKEIPSFFRGVKRIEAIGGKAALKEMKVSEIIKAGQKKTKDERIALMLLEKTGRKKTKRTQKKKKKGLDR